MTIIPMLLCFQNGGILFDVMSRLTSPFGFYEPGPNNLFSPSRIGLSQLEGFRRHLLEVLQKSNKPKVTSVIISGSMSIMFDRCQHSSAGQCGFECMIIRTNQTSIRQIIYLV